MVGPYLNNSLFDNPCIKIRWRSLLWRRNVERESTIPFLGWRIIYSLSHPITGSSLFRLKYHVFVNFSIIFYNYFCRSKLEKADILELTIEYIKMLQSSQSPSTHNSSFNYVEMRTYADKCRWNVRTMIGYYRIEDDLFYQIHHIVVDFKMVSPMHLDLLSTSLIFHFLLILHLDNMFNRHFSLIYR